MPITFDSGSNSIKITFLNSSQNLSNDILFVSAEVRIFPLSSIVFGKDIIMTSFLVTWLPNMHILHNFKWTISLEVSMLQVVFGKFYRQFKQNNDDVIMTSFHVVEILKSQIL